MRARCESATAVFVFLPLRRTKQQTSRGKRKGWSSRIRAHTHFFASKCHPPHMHIKKQQQKINGLMFPRKKRTRLKRMKRTTDAKRMMTREDGREVRACTRAGLKPSDLASGWSEPPPGAACCCCILPFKICLKTLSHTCCSALSPPCAQSPGALAREARLD